MNLALALGAASLLLPCLTKAAQADDISHREMAGDLAGVRAVLEQRANESHDAASWRALAEFQNRHHLGDRRQTFQKWAHAEPDPAQRRNVLRELVLLDFTQGSAENVATDLQEYRAAGGTDLSLPAQRPGHAKRYGTVYIPGPLRSFARMAALAPDLAPEELLPALGRNIVTNGYQAISSNETLDQTEYLRLVIRYLGQARELAQMAGSAHKIVIPACDSEQTGDLLRVLGYRMRGSCGGDVVLETVNATKAFITVDSAFPLSQLEQDLRANRKFELDYAPTPVPILYGPEYWLSALGGKGNRPDFIDAYLNDPSLCRLYVGLSKLDTETAEALQHKIPVSELKLFSPVLDFYGSMFQISNGAAFVPGSPKAWADLVGTSPSEGAGFYQKLIERDDGWMASYFDSLARLDSPAAAYLLRPDHLKRFYNALRGKITTPGPARPVFRSSTDLMLLTTSLRLDADGQPHIPGGIEVWKTLFIKHPHGKYDGKLTRAASAWRSPDDVLEALFALCRKSVENEPLHIFLAMSDIDRFRTAPLSPQLASRLIISWKSIGSQYSILADAPLLSENSINQFLDYIAASSNIRDTLARSDSLGAAQSLIGIWQILCRQGSISPTAEDHSFNALLQPFVKAKQSSEIFDAARTGTEVLLNAAGAHGSSVEAKLIDLLVGTPQPNAEHPGPAERLMRAMDAQRLVSLDTLFNLADGLAKGNVDKATATSFNAVLSRFEEAQSARNSLSGAERNLLSLGYWSERHIDQEHKVTLENLQKEADKHDARGRLTSFLRDTLVGFLYSYYSPPGAQIILANPMFVRNHDFIGAQGLQMSWRATEAVGTGWPASAGGRLMGSLVSLPYTMAEAEQNFLTPTKEQALIWGDLVPQIMVDVTVPRWRHITPQQIRWVSLHLQRGENLIAESAFNSTVEQRVIKSLARFASPARVEMIEERLRSGNFASVRAEILPLEFYAVALDPNLDDIGGDSVSVQIAALKATDNPALKPANIAAAFGTPKPTLTHSYRPGLLYLRTFPTLMGYSSRLMAETWESNGIYYAALADELGVPSEQLDTYVPEWTRQTIEDIFATHLEDWPALLRSLRNVGDSLRQRNNGSERAALNSPSSN